MREWLSTYIEHLHTKSEDERMWYATVATAVLTGALFLVWAGFFFARLDTGTVVVLPSTTEPEQTTQDTVNSIIESGAFIQPTPTTPSTPSAPAVPADVPSQDVRADDPLNNLL